MDARGFGMGPRTTYRQVRWSSVDAMLLVGGGASLALALLTSAVRPF
jgi:energy-coupling factor transporter transmembrane protein EcfT